MKLIFIILLNVSCFAQTANWLVGYSGGEAPVAEGAGDCSDTYSYNITTAATIDASATEDSLIITITHAAVDSIWDGFPMLGEENTLSGETAHSCWDSTGVRATLRFTIAIDESGLNRGSFYSFKYRIKGEDAVGVSIWSDADTVNIPVATEPDTTPPVAVTNFTATGFHTAGTTPKTYINLSWIPSVSTDVNYVKISIDSGDTYVSGDSIAAISGEITTYQDTTGGANETWSYLAEVYDDTGNVSISNPDDSAHIPNVATAPPEVDTTLFYVDKNADSTNNGTSWATAWESLGDINWSLIEPGDIIYISGGTDSTVYDTEDYDDAVLYINNVDGTKANPIKIYNSWETGHNGRVIFDGNGRTMTEGIICNYSSYLHIKGIEIRDVVRGVWVHWQGNYLEFDSLRITDFSGQYGFYTNGTGGYSTYPKYIDSIFVHDCYIESAARDDFGQTDCIVIAGTSNSFIYDNFIWQRAFGELPHTDGIQSLWNTGMRIYNNVIICDSVNLEAGNSAVIIRGTFEDEVYIYNNFLYNGGNWEAGGNTQATFWTRWIGDFTGLDKPKTYIFHNTIISAGGANNNFTLEWGGDDRGLIANNIIASYGDGQDPVDWFSVIRNSTTLWVDSMQNNLIWREWVTDNPQDLFSGGTWHGADTLAGDLHTWSLWETTLGGTGINVNPSLKDENLIGNLADLSTITGELQDTSNAINVGVDLRWLFIQAGAAYEDIGGNARVDHADSVTIGAYNPEWLR